MTDLWLLGDTRARLRELNAGSIHTCVTSPPYWGLRDYGCDGQIGLEPTFPEYIATLVDVFREVRRVLRDDGTLWLNLGDCYAGSWGAQSRAKTTDANDMRSTLGGSSMLSARQMTATRHETQTGSNKRTPGLKPKDLVGIPWRVAFALQDDGWYLRSDIVWHKPNPMPESVTDRPTKAHEYVFLLSKSERYHYDADAIREPVESIGRRCGTNSRANVDRDPAHVNRKQDGAGGRRYTGFNDRWDAAEAVGTAPTMRNRRTVWTVPPANFEGAHFATMPPALAEPCILAGSPIDGVVLDPFGGAGTTALVARRNGRRFVHIELNPAYLDLARRRVDGEAYQPALFGAA
jgi:DNA modification methylase